jgi:hypothetical protein
MGVGGGGDGEMRWRDTSRNIVHVCVASAQWSAREDSGGRCMGQKMITDKPIPRTSTREAESENDCKLQHCRHCSDTMTEHRE